MAFFHNRTVNLLNLHTAISMAALGGGGAFFSAYLLKAGLSVPGVLLAIAATFAARLVIRSFLVALAVRIGLKRLVIVGAVFMALQFLLLAEVHGVGQALLWLIFVGAIGDTIYWPSYHAYFAMLGDEEHRGQQTAMREALSAMVSIVSPLTAGWLLVAFGPHVAFYVTAAIQALSALPLLWTPDFKIARSVPGAYRAALSGVALFVADGWTAAGFAVSWQLALFLSLGQNYLAFGGALAVAALVGAVGGIVLGRYIDAGKGGRAVFYAIGMFSLVVLLRAGAPGHPVLAILANALGTLSSCLYLPTMMTAVYNQAKRAPCTLRFQIAAEGGWDVGVTAGCCLAALLVWLGLPLSVPILTALLGGVVIFVMLRRYYAAHPMEAIMTTIPNAPENDVQAERI